MVGLRLSMFGFYGTVRPPRSFSSTLVARLLFLSNACRRKEAFMLEKLTLESLYSIKPGERKHFSATKGTFSNRNMLIAKLKLIRQKI